MDKPKGKKEKVNALGRWLGKVLKTAIEEVIENVEVEATRDGVKVRYRKQLS